MQQTKQKSTSPVQRIVSPIVREEPVLTDNYANRSASPARVQINKTPPVYSESPVPQSLPTPITPTKVGVRASPEYNRMLSSSEAQSYKDISPPRQLVQPQSKPQSPQQTQAPSQQQPSQTHLSKNVRKLILILFKFHSSFNLSHKSHLFHIFF